MKRAARSRLLMVVAVAILAALAAWQWRHDAQRAVEALRSVNGHLLGVILNRVPTRRSGYYYYHYY